MTKRIGANRKKAMAAQRSQRPRRAKKFAIAAGMGLLIAAAGFAVYAYSPTVYSHVAETVKSTFKSNKELHAEFQIVNCGKNAQALLQAAIDSLLNGDSLPLCRGAVLRAGAQIPEIEKLNIKKTRDKKTLIRVTERTPVALVQDGSIWLVDRNGVRFKVLPGQYYDLPLLNFGCAGLRDTVELETFNTLKRTARNLCGAFFRQISQIDFSDSGSVNLVFKSGRTEYIIASKDIEDRLIHVKKLKERLRKEDTEPNRVDFRYRSLAVVSTL